MSHSTAVQQLPGYKLDQEAHYQTEYMPIGHAFLCSRITVLYALIGDFLCFSLTTPPVPELSLLQWMTN